MSKDSPETLSIDGSGLTIGVVAARYNKDLVNDLLVNLQDTLFASGVERDDLHLVHVSGSNEIPYAANMLALTGKYDCLVCLGVVVAGDTPHHEIIAHATAVALQKVALKQEIPVINGIVVVNNMAQALERCSGPMNRGAEFARTALEMATLSQELTADLHLLSAALERIDSMDEDELRDTFSSFDDWVDGDDNIDHDDPSDSWKL